MTAGDDGRAALPPPERPAHHPWKLLIIALGIAALLAFVDLREVVRIVHRIPARSIALAVILLSADRFLMGLKWWQLVRGAGVPMRLAHATAIYYQSKFTTLVFPAAFGGEVLRGVLGVRAGVPSHVLLASMVLERVIAAVSSLILAGVGLLHLSRLPSYARHSATMELLVGGAVVFLGLTTLVAVHQPSHKLIGRMLRGWVPDRIFQVLERFSRTAVQYRRSPGVLLVNLTLTLIEHIVLMLALYVLAVGLGVHLTLVHFLAASSIIMLVRRGAGFLEGWGVAESGVVMLYTLFGVAPNRSAALALALWATSLLACLPGGYLLWKGTGRAVLPQDSTSGENLTS